MNLTYSPAVETDIEVLFEFNKQLIDTYEDLSSIDYGEILAWVRRKIEKRLYEYSRILCNGSLAGYIRVSESDNEVELDDLYILPEYRGQGIGGAVLKSCIERADKPIFFYVFKKNTRAIALYERTGFVIAEKVGDTRYIMRYKGKRK